MISLIKLQQGEKGIIKELLGGHGMKRKLECLGIRVDKTVRISNDMGGRGPFVVEIDNMKIAIGHGMAKHIIVDPEQLKILLIGNPNVGKSVVFSRLTGLDVISSNYPGTTVEYIHGTTRIDSHRVLLIDAPGAYTLVPTNKAEEVTSEMITNEKPDLIINVVDATNLERNLYLTLQILEKNIPTVIVLNKWDIAQRKGIQIDLEELSKKIGVAAIPFVAVIGEGIKELFSSIREILASGYKAPKNIPSSDDDKWKLIGEISRFVQKIVHKHPTLLEKIADASIQPIIGFPIALFVLIATFFTIRYVGEGLINYVLDPLFSNFYYPFIKSSVEALFPSGVIHALLLGTTPQLMESFGVLTTGIYVPLVVVMPYILTFYFVLGFLEDLGYLPRLAVLMDNAFHKVGLHGFATIPIILGLGCKVPAMLSVRILETHREKIIAMVLIMIIAPCMPQSAMIISILAEHGLKYLVAVFGTLFLVGIAASYTLNKLLKGESPELFIEIPPYHLPRIDQLFKKLWIRLKGFVFEAVPLIVAGILVINILDMVGFVKLFSNTAGPFIANLLGLPKEISSVMVFGFLRKDISIALLYPFDLSPKQLVVASTFLVLYLPCIATFFVLLKEIGIKHTLKIITLTFTLALLVGMILNFIL